MKSNAIGVVVAGVAAWFGALEAQAQGINITVTGPSAVYTDTSTIQFDGTVSGYNDYNFRLWVYLNGVQKHDSGTLCYTGTAATYFVYNAQNWAMQANDEVKFRVRVWLTSTIYDMEYLYITVQQSGYYTYLESSDVPAQEPAAYPGPVHTAAVRNDERELLA